VHERFWEFVTQPNTLDLQGEQFITSDRSIQYDYNVPRWEQQF
jgi:hypothetical protein